MALIRFKRVPADRGQGFECPEHEKEKQLDGYVDADGKPLSGCQIMEQLALRDKLRIELRGVFVQFPGSYHVPRHDIKPVFNSVPMKPRQTGAFK